MSHRAAALIAVTFSKSRFVHWFSSAKRRSFSKNPEEKQSWDGILRALPFSLPLASFAVVHLHRRAKAAYLG
jgi:hypothetical protein